MGSRGHWDWKSSRIVIAVAATVLTVTGSAAGARVAAGAVPLPSPSVTEFQPSLHATNPFAPANGAAYGGRTVAVDIEPGSGGEVVIAATSSGGLFKSSNSGSSWSHVDGLVPARIDDVRYVPKTGPGHTPIIATTEATADAHNPGGIWRSSDGGVTWTAVATGLCKGNYNAGGIAPEPGSANVYVGTDCGLAASADRGATWTIAPLARVHAAVAANGIVDVCADDGHHRFLFAVGTLTPVGGTDPINPTGRFGAGCAMGFDRSLAVHAVAAAPQEPNAVLFLSAPQKNNEFSCNSLYESDDGGLSWVAVLQECPNQIPGYVATRLSTDGDPNHFDVYYANNQFSHKITCAAHTAGQRCATPLAGPTAISTAHADHQGIVFGDASSCPVFLATDGGVQQTTDCGASFHMAAGSGALNGNFNALQIYNLTGQISSQGHTDLYFGTQDNNTWASPDKGASWPVALQGELGDVQVPRIGGDASEFPTFVEGSSAPPGMGPAEFAGCTYNGVGACTTWNRPPASLGPPPQGPRGFDTEGAPRVIERGTDVEWTEPDTAARTDKLNITTDFGATWNPIAGATVTGLLTDHPFIAGSAASPTIYQVVCSGGCFGPSTSTLQVERISVTRAAGGASATVRAAGGTCPSCLVALGTYSDLSIPAGFHTQQPAFGVDPSNPDHLVAADAGTGQMKVSRDGGLHWKVDRRLTHLVKGSGRFAFATPRVGTQARAISFDPTNGNHIVVGTENAGIIASVDGGATWARMLGSERVTSVTDFFFDEVPNEVLVSTFGRGLWKLRLARPT